MRRMLSIRVPSERRRTIQRWFDTRHGIAAVVLNVCVCGFALHTCVLASHIYIQNGEVIVEGPISVRNRRGLWRNGVGVLVLGKFFIFKVRFILQPKLSLSHEK